MSLGTILVILLIIFLLGGFSGRFGGYGYGFGHGGIGVIGVILIILVVLLLMGRICSERRNGEHRSLKAASIRGLRGREPPQPNSAAQAGTFPLNEC
jgi:Na+/melibiose symporter-like transporter